MRGFPRYLNTKEDVRICLQLYPEETKQYLAALYQNRFVVKELKVLVDNEAGLVDDLHEVVSRESPDGTLERVQFQKVEDPNARIFQLRLTKTEVEVPVGQEQAHPPEGTK